MSTLHKLYVGESFQKKKGHFHHSSFLVGGVILAARRLSAEEGILQSISTYSGHYRPWEESLKRFRAFLEENGENLDEVKMNKLSHNAETDKQKSNVAFESPFLGVCRLMHLKVRAPKPEYEPASVAEDSRTDNPEDEDNDKQDSLSGGLQSLRRLARVPRRSVLERISSKKAMGSYQLGHELKRTWSTGAGPRIGCVGDYPAEIRHEALEFVNQSHGHAQTA